MMFIYDSNLFYNNWHQICCISDAKKDDTVINFRLELKLNSFLP